MIDIFPGIEKWVEDQHPFALATVIKTWGSAPRLVGSALAVTPEMNMLGSVSGGCVEGAVMKEALALMDAGGPKLLSYGVADEDAWAVGLSCGGKIDLLVERFVAFDSQEAERKLWPVLQKAIQHNQGCVWLTRMVGPSPEHYVYFPDGRLLGSASNPNWKTELQRVYTERKNQVIQLGEESYFALVIPPKSQLLIVGAAHISVDLVDLANQFGFETIVIDPRGIFTNKTQFRKEPDHKFESWPADVLPQFSLDPYTYAVLLTHDPKIDDQALHMLLNSEVGYIGCLGSKRTHAKRVKRLNEAGFSEEKIDRIHGPIGVDINAKLPKEIALSILAEIIQVKNQFL